MPVYESTATICKRTFEELKYHLILPRQRQSSTIVISGIIIFLVNAVIRRDSGAAYLFGLLLIIAVLSQFIVINKNVRIYSKKLWQATKREPV